MAVNPISGARTIIATQLDVQTKTGGLDNLSGFNLGSKTWGNTVTRTGSPMQPAVPADLLFMAKIFSGALTIKFKKHAEGATPTFGAPDETLALDAAVDTTMFHGIILHLAAAEQVTPQGVSGAAGAVVANYLAEFQAPLSSGKDMETLLSRGWTVFGDGGGTLATVASA
jgi:hypothetical protein